MIESGGISRRKALQRIGVGAVAVWSAPMITSVASAASVGSPMPGCQTIDCSAEVPCPGKAGCFGPYQTATGSCSCVGGAFFFEPSCSLCGAGQICITQSTHCGPPGFVVCAAVCAA